MDYCLRLKQRDREIMRRPVLMVCPVRKMKVDQKLREEDIESETKIKGGRRKKKMEEGNG